MTLLHARAVALSNLARIGSTCWLATTLLFAGCQSGRPNDVGPRKIEVLFLGHDSRHHDSEAYAPMLASALALEGIHINYTSDPADLNPQTLALYDALILYANHDSIAPSQEKALLDFVASGKGFVPIHSASYCFRNSDDFVALVGAQFKSHETGTFTAETIAADHPIVAGLAPFETWDETYVHDLHNPDRTVLQERVEGDHREPWTWTRTHGDGRVFYTAYGHDERTWSNPGFHDLVKRGILWAVGDDLAGRWEQLSLQPLTYVPHDSIPNYEKRDPPLDFQHPLAPESSMAYIQVPPEFELQLFAAEPDILKPIAMAWDERGRLWVIETQDYPNTVNPDHTGTDRIKILEDTDGDGRADRFTIFADSLNIPTSLTFANDGVIVSMAPHFLFLKDTDRDHRADLREVILPGWGTFDTHAGPSNP
ncbi:MAG: PVC-type heme-binding CxxCH protein [Rhodothermales bacterium]|nr:PVC-type heme-binding CxxCH protein [Rhodothermales bacterium]